MNLFEKTKHCVMDTYKRFEVSFVRGEGVYLYDEKNNRYLDFLSGIAVNVLGHAHPVITKAIKEQADKLLHVSNLYHIKEQTELACWLTENSVLDKVFFCNSGAEANEAAIKLARLYGNKKGKNKIITMLDSFHGRTIATLSATGQTKYQQGFEPMLDGFDYVEFNDFERLKSKLDDTVCAVIIECIQGEGGINVADKIYIEKVYDYCTSKDILFIADEVQTGIGRSGKFFAYEHYSIEPDIMTLSKALGGGIPIGAMLAKDSVAEHFTYGTHGSTFGGSPFASSVSLAVVKYVKESGLMDSVVELGDYFVDKLNDIAISSDMVIGVSGFGYIIGLHTKDSETADEIVKRMLEKRVLVGKAGGSTVRFEPPLIAKKEHIDQCLDVLDSII